jgi:protein TonB
VSAQQANDTSSWFVCIAIACTLHGACVVYFASERAAALPKPKLKELEVTMLDPELPPPPPPPVTPEPPPEPEKPARAERAKAAAPPSPARAGALLTTPEEPTPSPTADEPVRFVTDPNGRGYGSGMVARGGTADHEDHAVPVPLAASTAPAAKPGLVFAERLSRQPSLGAYDPCRGFFPQGAQTNRGEVSVIATVRDQGSVVRTEIESEAPLGQGFGAAARACLTKQRFEPALDDAGKPTAARTRVRITFARQ